MIFDQAPVDRKVRTFSLSDAFLEDFRDKQPAWGFGALSYFTYKRTYSRAMPDGTSEEFWQTCRRVVEGVYNIQKIHCRRLGLPWSEAKAQKSAQEMYTRMWEFKWTPPGRGLWMMGTDIIYEKGSASLNNCFAPETQVVIEGANLATLGDLAEHSQGEKPVMIRAGDGEMRPAVAKGFGKQRLFKVSFAPAGRRTNFRLEYDVTRNHRWILADGTETTDLKVGDVVKVTPDRYFQSKDTDEVEGFAHGLVFGDGAQHTYYPYRHQIRLCGAKEQTHVARLEQSTHHFNTTHPESYNGDAMVWFKLPEGVSWKALPTVNTSVAYQRAFLQGWIAADAGTQITKSANRILCTQKAEAAQWLIDRAPLLGFCVTGFNYDPTMVTAFGPRSAPMAHITLTEEAVDYRVKSITDEGREEEVYCVTEPETGTFTLAGGMVTGNCAFVSSENIGEDFSGPFTFLMDMSMLGVGVGGDTRGVGKARIQTPRVTDAAFVVEDSREGWVAMTRTVLDSFVGKGHFPTTLDFRQVRPRGEPILGFGGVASGPNPLARLAKNIVIMLLSPGVEPLFEEVSNETHPGEIGVLHTTFRGEGKPYRITSGGIVDIFNMVGACVVAGGVRRSAEIMFGQADDKEFRALKDPTDLIALDALKDELKLSLDRTQDSDPEMGILQRQLQEVEAEIEQHPMVTHRWASNNSIFGEVGMDYSEVAPHIAANGEPGILWLDNMRGFSRMADPRDDKDWRAMGMNPCVEQSLESYELCCLVETYPAHHESYEDFERTLKFAYLYAKTVTLVPTHDQRTNAVMNRNRRIGCSQSGIRQAITRHGRRNFLQWCAKGYGYIQKLDRTYSDWLGVPLSIKTTSVKPSGTVSLLAGATPGVHAAHSEYYIRNVRVAGTSPLVMAARVAGFTVEKDRNVADTWVVSFPVKTPNYDKGKNDLSIWEQFAMVADLQRHWADNSVSATITFRPDEVDQIQTCLEVFEDRLKAISLLPYSGHGYVQAPYIEITEDEYITMMGLIRPLDLVDQDTHEVDDKFCDGVSCEIPPGRG